jgi:hypothetical protein
MKGTKLRSRWPILFSVIVTLLFASYYSYSNSIYPAHRSVYKVVYGVLSFATILFLASYIMRKHIYCYRLGSQQSWLQAHSYIGILSIILVFMHSGFKLDGTFSIFLSVLFFLLIISGIIGSLIYNRIPISLTKYGRKLNTEEEIAAKIESYLKEADNLVSVTSNTLKDTYRREIRPLIESKRPKFEYLFMEERELICKRREKIERCKASLLAEDMHDLSILSSILVEKEKLSFVCSKLHIQKAWLTFHMPLTLTLLTSVVIHIVSIIYY